MALRSWFPRVPRTFHSASSLSLATTKIMASPAGETTTTMTMTTMTGTMRAATTPPPSPPPPPPPPLSTVPKVPIPPRGVDYRGKIVLAPMVRSGELPSRLLALHYGADLVWGPETVDYSMIGTTRRVNLRTGMIEYSREPSNNHAKASPHKSPESVIYRLDPAREAGKLVFQIGTSDPERAVAAARLVAADVAGIDVNAGCPKPFSTSGGMGAALLRTPDKLVAILEALVGNIVPEFQIGVSVKIRLLETAAETEELVRRLVKTGITGLTIHCRTTPMRPRERAIRGQLRMIANVCREAGVACLVNGDVENRDHGIDLAREYGCDGAMIATCAEKNPSCFRAKSDGGMETWQQAVEKYLRFAMEVENKMGNTKFMLTQMVPGRDGTYRQMQGCKSYGAFVKLFGFEGLEEMADKADRVLQLGAYEAPPEPKKPREAKNQQQNMESQMAQDKKRKREEDVEEKEEGEEAPKKHQHQHQQQQQTVMHIEEPAAHDIPHPVAAVAAATPVSL